MIPTLQLIGCLNTQIFFINISKLPARMILASFIVYNCDPVKVEATV